MMLKNPCVTCGACCAYFRISFYWGEADPQQGGAIPPEMVEELSPFRRCLKGTNQQKPRCIALSGDIGEGVFCSIYPLRSSPCREFGVHWHYNHLYFEPGEHARCSRARAAWGLSPLPQLHPQMHPLRKSKSHIPHTRQHRRSGSAGAGRGV